MQKQEYFGYVTLTKKRKVLAVAGFNQAQAQTALNILAMPVAHRQDHGRRLLAAVARVKVNGEILASPRSQGGIYTGTAVPLPKRAAKLIALACLSGNDPGIEALKTALERIAAGLAAPRSIVHPFLHTEISSPIKV